MSNKTFTQIHLDILRAQLGKISRVDPDSPTLAALRKQVSEMHGDMLAQVAKEDIRWLTYLARQEILQRAAATAELAKIDQLSGRYEIVAYFL